MLKKTLSILIVSSIFEIYPAEGRILNVPAAYPTIQAGINSAVDGDTVLAAAGTYTGAGNVNLNFLGKAIVVISASGADNTIINCQNRARGALFVSGEGNETIFEGFRVINGLTGIDAYGGGALCWESSPVIRNNQFITCQAYYGGGIGVIGGNPIIENNLFEGNIGDRGGGIIIAGGGATITSNSFIDNYSTGG